MKANELRLGNWYDENGIHRQVNPNTIQEIWIAERTWIQPIPLTEEWLLKFGFKEDGYYNSAKKWRGIFNQPLIQGNGYFTIPNYFSTEIKYVHQLQNLYFALTNTELQIVK